MDQNYSLKKLNPNIENEYTLICLFYQMNPNKFISYNNEDGIDLDLEYYGLYNKDTSELCAITSTSAITDNSVNMWGTLVREDLRGVGIGKILNLKMEKELKSLGYNKISSHIYIENLPSIILKLKLGYIIEGTLYNHDEMEQHEYILRKML